MRRVAFFHVGEVKHYIHKMIESVKRHVSSPLVFFTDFETQDISGVDETVRRDYGPMMYAKVCHARDYECDELCLLDTDILALDNFEDAYEKDFDVAMYCRSTREKDSQYNGGVVFTKKRDFWGDCARVMEGLSQDLQRWMGDQVAYNRVAMSGKYKVFDLPQRYNCVPENVMRAKLPNQGTALVHYKGERKKWMK